MSTYINFRELRAQLDFRTVLEQYNVTIEVRKGAQHQGRCPLPTHLGAQSKAPFSADLARGIWKCFGCKTSGNILDFAVRMDGLNPDEGADVRRVALALQTRYLGGEAPAPQIVVTDPTAPPAQSVLVNAPLSFELQSLDADHESLTALSLQQTTIERFGLGFCSRGFLKGRIAIPLHDRAGVLVGYAGRRTAPTDEPLYRFPEERSRGGITYKFDPLSLLYGAHWLLARSPKLFVCEDFSLVWHLWEFGIQAVALPTQQLSAEQTKFLHEFAEPGGLVFVGRSVWG